MEGEFEIEPLRIGGQLCRRPVQVFPVGKNDPILSIWKSSLGDQILDAIRASKLTWASLSVFKRRWVNSTDDPITTIVLDIKDFKSIQDYIPLYRKMDRLVKECNLSNVNIVIQDEIMNLPTLSFPVEPNLQPKIIEILRVSRCLWLCVNVLRRGLKTWEEGEEREEKPKPVTIVITIPESPPIPPCVKDSVQANIIELLGSEDLAYVAGGIGRGSLHCRGSNEEHRLYDDDYRTPATFGGSLDRWRQQGIYPNDPANDITVVHPSEADLERMLRIHQDQLKAYPVGMQRSPKLTSVYQNEITHTEKLIEIAKDLLGSSRHILGSVYAASGLHLASNKRTLDWALIEVVVDRVSENKLSSTENNVYGGFATRRVRYWDDMSEDLKCPVPDQLFDMFSISMLAGLVAAVMAATPPDYSKDPAGNPTIHPALGELVEAGKPFEITWTPTTQGAISIILLRGPSNNVVPIATIVDSTANDGAYTWTPSTDLEGDVTGYGIQIVVEGTGQYQWSPQFGIKNDKKTPGPKPTPTSSYPGDDDEEPTGYPTGKPEPTEHSEYPTVSSSGYVPIETVTTVICDETPYPTGTGVIPTGTGTGVPTYPPSSYSASPTPTQSPPPINNGAGQQAISVGGVLVALAAVFAF
ncbi:hypothetical protein FQN57_005911 [Myotisia sp. PD_48]|nr:hypothetical protein FQN57_005911 [Myotisia sp. PD_48]